MDILRKELNDLYESQNLAAESLDPAVVASCRVQIAASTAADGICRVITDASCDECVVFRGGFGCLLGIAEDEVEVDSSDEDQIYDSIHPEDLVDKRMLEYEFFRFAVAQPAHLRTHYKATCRIRLRDINGSYVNAINTTQILKLSPRGNMWLILCSYDFAGGDTGCGGISPRIINNMTGECIEPDFSVRRARILTEREKEVLRLIGEGRASKQIADIMGISVHTVNRHRQNILGKLSVANSVEAIMAATAMRLM